MGDDMFSCLGCTKSFCLDIQNKMNVVEKFHLLVRTLNTNDDDNEEKICVILTKFKSSAKCVERKDFFSPILIKPIRQG